MTVLSNSAADCHFTGSRALRHNLSNALPKYEFVKITTTIYPQ